MKAAETPFIRGIKKIHLYSQFWAYEPMLSQMAELRYDTNNTIPLDYFGELEHVDLMVAPRDQDVFNLPADGSAGQNISKKDLSFLQAVAVMIRDYAIRRKEIDDSFRIPRITSGTRDLI